MKIVKSYYLVALVAIAVSTLIGISGVDAEPEPDESATRTPSEGDKKETIKYIPTWAKGARDIVEFDAMLRKLVKTADIPEEEEFKKRLESESGWVEVITDGYGGVVDFNAAKGTIQHKANNLIGSGFYIDWEFELAGDTEISYDKSTRFIPKIALIANEGKGKSEPQVRFFISIAETDVGPLKAGDRIRLRASIDDFSRFKKRYSKATGLVAIYYLEDTTNPVFDVRLDEAEVTLLESNTGEQGGGGQPVPRTESK